MLSYKLLLGLILAASVSLMTLYVREGKKTDTPTLLPLHPSVFRSNTNVNMEKYTEEAQKDMVTSLPGLNFYYASSFAQFSGYLSVDDENHRFIHYWYVESSRDPENDPVILWTNGGPGCSGLLGFGTEFGPFYFQGDGTLALNPHTWNSIANIVYMEQPVGVGFSYSNNPDVDYITGDDRAKMDNFKVIQEFFKRFPERKSNDFYIASESYGGHYIPQCKNMLLGR